MRFAALVLLVGCGRVSFDTSSDGATDSTMLDASFCAGSTASFCSDFNDGGTVGWTLGGMTNGGYLVDNFSLRASNNALATNTDFAEAYLNHYFNSAASRITLDFDLRITQREQGDIVVAQIRFEGAQNHGFEYVYRANGSYGEEFRDNQYDSISIPGPSFPVDEWHRVEMDMDLRTTPRVVVKHDGVIVIDSPLLGNMTGMARLSAGLVFLRGPSSPWMIFVDNVSSIIE